MCEQRRVYSVLIGLCVALALAVGIGQLAPRAPTRQASGHGALATACGSPNPWLAGIRSADNRRGLKPAEVPVLFAFREAFGQEDAQQEDLATYGQLGSIFGLAYDAQGQQLYTAAFLRRGSLFPPGGPGAIQRVDLGSGAVLPFARLPTGAANLHHLGDDDDAAVADWVGRAGLGDLDIDPQGRQLLAVNLFDRRIYRLSLADGQILGSFPHGASGEPWADEAQLFGLGWHGGWLYHAVVEAYGGRRAGNRVFRPVGHVYRSRTDGSDLSLVWSFSLDPERAEPDPGDWSLLDYPAITDLVFRDDGGLLVSVRNLSIDRSSDGLPGRLGDLLVGLPEGDGWRAQQLPETFDDAVGGFDEVLTGGVAWLPGIGQLVAAGHAGRFDQDAAAAWWYDQAGGIPQRYAALPQVSGGDAIPLPGGGAVELLCAPDSGLDPERAAAATAAIGGFMTATAAAEATAVIARATAAPIALTALAPTLRAMAPTREALATRAARQTVPADQATAAAKRFATVQASCLGDDPYLVTAHRRSVAGRLDARRQSLKVEEALPFDGLTALNRRDPILRLAEPSQTGSNHGLAYDGLRAQLYVGAADVRFPGPAGATGIYQLSLETGRLAVWAMLPSGRPPRSQLALPLAGLGDLEIDDRFEQLFAVNLADGFIYRFKLPEGTLLGAFAHGAMRENWAEEAYPFALAWDGAWLYHAVVPSDARRVARREALMYRSRADGGDMTLLARMPLTARGSTFLTNGATFVPDLIVRRDGTAVLGVLTGPPGPVGYLLPAQQVDSSWRVASPEEADERYPHRGFRLTASLADLARGQGLVVTASDVQGVLNTGLVWYATAGGTAAQQRVVTEGRLRQGSIVRGSHAKRIVLGDYEVLGDVESLCPELPSPDPTPAPSATETALPTPSAASTATLTPTASPTLTPTPISTATASSTALPRSLFLPLLLWERCSPESRRVDAVLVLDASRSMMDPDGPGSTRSKLEAAKAAAAAFLDVLRLDLGDQAAVVSFNERGVLDLGLSADRLALDHALDGIAVAAQTCIACGLDVAAAELLGPRHRAGQAQVMVLLTDGRSNPQPAAVAVQRAAAAKLAGLRVYTVGLGDDIDEDALRAMASEAAGYFHAPSGRELAAIYRDIAIDLPCPPAAFWSGR